MNFREKILAVLTLAILAWVPVILLIWYTNT